MGTGIELIRKKLEGKLIKHNISVANDVRFNSHDQLVKSAEILLGKDWIIYKKSMIPVGWDKEKWEKAFSEPYKERLVTAATLIVAQLDILIANEE